MYDTILCFSCVRCDLESCLHTIQSLGSLLYDINLGATATTILRIRGVQIPIDLVSSATDSYRRSVVLFKPMSVPTSDLKSEFLCQSSYIVQNIQAPPESPRTPGISPMPLSPRITHTHSLSALTEYLKQKLRLQQAKQLGRSLPARVEPNVQLERNSAFDMNKSNGGKQRKQKDTTILMSNPELCFRGLPQKMTLETGEPKGLQQTLEERGFNITGMRAKCSPVCPIENEHCCMACLLSKEEDFRNQVSLLEQTITDRGHLCMFLPKFHYELNPIEMVHAFVSHMQLTLTLRLTVLGMVQGEIPGSFQGEI